MTIKVKVIVDTNNLRCPLCLEGVGNLASGNATQCPICDAWHHSECMEEMKKCGAFGCSFTDEELMTITVGGETLRVTDADREGIGIRIQTAGGRTFIAYDHDEAAEAINDRYPSLQDAVEDDHISSDQVLEWAFGCARGGESVQSQWLDWLQGRYRDCNERAEAVGGSEWCVEYQFEGNEAFEDEHQNWNYITEVTSDA